VVPTRPDAPRAAVAPPAEPVPQPRPQARAEPQPVAPIQPQQPEIRPQPKAEPKYEARAEPTAPAPLAAPAPSAPARPSAVPPPVAPTQAQPEIRPQPKAEPKYEARADPRPPAPVAVAPALAAPARPSTAPGPDQAAVSALPTAPKQANVDENAVLRRFADEISRVLGKSVSERDYPRLARQQNWQGTTEVRLQIGSDGKVKDVVVGRTSGYDLLDQRAIQLVKQLRLPKIPSAFRQREFTVTVPITFALRNS